MSGSSSEMPNPFIIIVIFGITLLLVRLITTFIHELGHAVAALILLKGKVSVYVGTHGNAKKGMRIKIGRVWFHLVYAPFELGSGLCVSEQQAVTPLKDFMVTLAGPIASLLSAIFYLYVGIFSDFSEIIKLSFFTLSGSSFLDCWYNLKPDTTPIELEDGKIAYNDGYNLVYNWKLMFAKEANE